MGLRRLVASLRLENAANPHQFRPDSPAGGGDPRETRAATLASVAHSHRLEEADMNCDRVEGNCRQFRGKVQEQLDALTNDDLDKIERRQDQLERLIQEHYGKSRDEAKRAAGSRLTRG
jgi:uncharacterized protein YjbJ (UPF0337 family)